MFYVYIIFSESLNAFYIGQTMDVNQRIEEHNSKFYKNTSTAKADDWTLFFAIECESRKQAILVENHIKKMKSRKYYLSIKEHIEISTKLLEMYSE